MFPTSYGLQIEDDTNKLVFSAGKPQSLFAKLGKKNFEQQSSAQKENTEA